MELRETRDFDKKKYDTSKAAYREYESELFEELRELGIRGTLTFDFGGDLGTAAFVSRATTYGTIVDKRTAIEALKREGHTEAIMEEAIREGRLNELVRTYHETGKELPEGVDFYERKIISISRKG